MEQINKVCLRAYKPGAVSYEVKRHSVASFYIYVLVSQIKYTRQVRVLDVRCLEL